MPKYRTDIDRFISHEARFVAAGEEFETEFPLVNGKPMQLSDTLHLVEEAKGRRGRKAAVDASQDGAEADAAEVPSVEDGVS